MASLTIKLTESAYSDIEDVENYVSQSSPKIGRDFVNKIFTKIEILYDQPRIGRKVPEFDNDRIRELMQGKYRIAYRIVSDDLIEVLRIIHGSRLMDLE
jgi:plasmid stabilization system protein ParE